MQLNSFLLNPSWRLNILTKEQFFQNPHNNTVLLVQTTLISDPGLRFGKLQNNIDDFYSNITAQFDTDNRIQIKCQDI